MPKHQIMHVGINCARREEALGHARMFAELFQVDMQERPASAFTDEGRIEWMYQKGPGLHGHIAVGTDDITGSLKLLEEQGIYPKKGSEIVRGEKLLGVYLDWEICGFAVHLLQINN